MVVPVLPGVEAAAHLPGPLHDLTQAPVAAAEEALKFAGLDIVPAQVQARPAQFPFEKLLFFQHLFP